jgi:hypothetical protein
LDPIKRIRAIEVQNIKGIAQREFQLDLIPNKPSLLVAPNGFGKSSLATAFGSLSTSRLELHKDNFHKGNELLQPKLTIEYTLDDNSHDQREATGISNGISEVFDVHVINSQLVSRSKKLKIKGNIIVMSSIEVSPVTLIKKIPEAAKFRYSYAEEKRKFGKNGKVLPNIEHLLAEKQFICQMYKEIDFSKATLVKSITAVEALKKAINAVDGPGEKILSVAEANCLALVSEIGYLSDIAATLKKLPLGYTRNIEFYLAALQMASLYTSDKVAFKKVVIRYNYQIEKEQYQSTFNPFKTTWKSIVPKEDKANGLIIEFPKANQISNGERDIICFVALLMQAKAKFTKNQCILIIDEIFDYLDDGNLIAAQYYLTQMIEDFKSQGRQIFPLILTHLNPNYFKNFCFKDQKIYYLDKVPANSDRLVEKIIAGREDGTIKDNVARHFLHYHPNEISLTKEFDNLGLPTDLSTSGQFSACVFAELDKYLTGSKYDPIAVCCAVRILIERHIYKTLQAADQQGFLETHKTPNKLDYASDRGIEIPEVFYMLGIIYNEALHFKLNRDNFTPLYSKLGNLTIRNMLRWCYECCSSG